MNKARLCFIFLSAILIGATVHAQEVLTGIVLNKPIAREAAKEVKTYVREGALPLPFVDDFSNYLGYPILICGLIEKCLSIILLLFVPLL